MKQSAGILLYRLQANEIEVLLVHPGGPFWQYKDIGAWSIPKGEFNHDEDPLVAAKRELMEETGINCTGPFIKLPEVKQRSGKIIFAWVTKCNAYTKELKSNTFEIEWPPRSGKLKTFPEVDRMQWFSTSTAKQKINPAQVDFIDALVERFNDLKA